MKDNTLGLKLPDTPACHARPHGACRSFLSSWTALWKSAQRQPSMPHLLVIVCLLALFFDSLPSRLVPSACACRPLGSG